MKFYLYTIEVQKPSGTHRFIKSFAEPLTIDKKEINTKNPQAISIYDDRTEVISFLQTVEATTKEKLLETYYNLVRTHRLSLEFTEDEWVYLIPRRHPKRTFRLAHKLPVLPRYKKQKPIKFYKEKPIEDFDEDTDEKEETLAREFHTQEWFTYFTKLVQNLLYIHCGRHSLSYVVMEAFVLTYAKFYQKKLKGEQDPNACYSLFQIEERAYRVDEAADITFLRYDLARTEPTYTTYIKPTLEGDVPFLVGGRFYSLETKFSFMEIFWNFMTAAQDWTRENG